MPADHLTHAIPLTDAVQRVLAGTPLHTAAAAARLDPDDLADATDTYHTAGLAALHQQSNDAWYHVRVVFPYWNTAEHTASTHLGPMLHANAVDTWWFLRKHPSWRLRIRTDDPRLVNEVLDNLTARGAILRWSRGQYEPETTAFGGPHGMHIAHELFCADSHGVLTYLRQPEPGLGRRELSLLLLGGLLHTAGLDWFERGDVFANVAQLRPTDTDDTRTLTLARTVRGLLAVPPDPDNALFQPGGAAGFARTWLTAHMTAGHHLSHAATAGTLHRGLRAVLTHIVIFHWNRLGLPAHTQGILARAAAEAFLPRERP